MPDCHCDGIIHEVDKKLGVLCSEFSNFRKFLIGNGQSGELVKIKSRLWRVEVVILLLLGGALGPKLFDLVLAVARGAP